MGAQGGHAPLGPFCHLTHEGLALLCLLLLFIC